MAMQTPDPTPLDKVLFNPLTAAFAAFCLVVSFFLPVDGLGVNLCWFQWWFELPCPGCGLTRSVTCISHWQWAKAISYHPFGPLVYGLFATNLLIYLLPLAKRNAVRQRLADSHRCARPIYIANVVMFLLFGLGRIVYKLWLLG